MEVQEIGALIITAAAAGWLGLRAYRALRRKDCGGGCKGCSTIDFSKIGPKS